MPLNENFFLSQYICFALNIKSSQEIQTMKKDKTPVVWNIIVGYYSNKGVFVLCRISYSHMFKALCMYSTSYFPKQSTLHKFCMIMMYKVVIGY